MVTPCSNTMILASLTLLKFALKIVFIGVSRKNLRRFVLDLGSGLWMRKKKIGKVRKRYNVSHFFARNSVPLRAYLLDTSASWRISFFALHKSLSPNASEASKRCHKSLDWRFGYGRRISKAENRGYRNKTMLRFCSWGGGFTWPVTASFQIILVEA